MTRAHDPLRRFAWSRFKNCGLFTISASRARPSAEIRMVEVQKLRTFYDFCGPRATLCDYSRGRGSKTEGFLRFLRCTRDPLRRSCASKRFHCGAVRICLSLGEPSAEIVHVEALSLWRRAFFSLRTCFRNPTVAGSIPPWSAAAPARKSQLLCTNVVRGAPPQLQLQICNF